MYNILKLKLKSVFDILTKEGLRALKIMILGFILIIAIIIIKYKPVYEVKVNNETLGYVENKNILNNMINENILNVEGQNIESVALKEEPKYEAKLIDMAYVDTIEEAEEVVEKAKEDNKDKDIELNLAISEEYTTKKEEVKTDKVDVAETSIEDKIEELIDEKEAKEAIATIEGINLSVLPVSGKITSRFGVSSSIRSGAHTGLDIACSSGTDIKAVAKGKVIFAENNGSYGNLVKIDHGNGVETWYAHCSKIYTKVGAQVKAGDVIAAVGSTGNSTGPHLHLEIRIDGTAINPQKYLYK